MSKCGLYLLALLSVIAVSITTVPAYAEVTSLKTDASFYKGSSQITFSGTVLPTDSRTITILIFDPQNNYLVRSGIADSNDNFQIIIDTGSTDSSIQQEFKLKGTYNATAFVANKANGITVNFVFSPDGSPVLPSSPTSLSATVVSSTEIDLNWIAPVNNGGTPSLGYQIGRSTDGGTTWSTTVTTITATTFADVGLTPNTPYMYRVYAVNQAGSSPPSNATTASTLQIPGQTVSQGTTTNTANSSSTPSLAELLQQRLADAQRLQQLLNGGNPTQPSSSGGNPTTNPSGNSQTVQLNETMSVNDVSSSQGVQQSTNPSGNNSTQNNSTNFNANLAIYSIISLVGVGIVVYILYLRKKRNPSGDAVKVKKETIVSPETPSNQNEDDHAMMILKNRLAKGEITVAEFKELRDELSEP
ncbi:MAG TPA: fibronectin type III domain-containing protein [Candidatus Nitrosotalea sp.]|nr:fibronectin type III domain-containing protein [Candidatus Nitrosotalea sp.]